MVDYTIIACTSASMGVLLATYVVYDFFTYVSVLQTERFLSEASTELDDVLIMIPANRVLDISIALAAIVSFISMLTFSLNKPNWSWPQMTFVGLIALIASFPAPRLYLRFLKKRRLNKFNEQLEDALTSMSSSLKAGFSINQAIEAVANENRRPISVEFRLLVQELRLGVPLNEALYKMVDRLKSEDFELVAAAIVTARQTGGALTETLERLASLIRERLRIHLKLKAITAQGKMQATIIGLMPIVLMFFMNSVAPEMMAVFFDSVGGILLLIVTAVLVIIGFLMIKKITTIDI